MSRRAAVGSLALVLVGTGVQATTVAELCGTPVPDPCRITTTHTVEAGSVLDFRPGALVLSTTAGRLDAGAGSMAILAREVILDAGSRLQAAGGRIAVLATDRISVNASARIDVSATAGGGNILLGASGDIAIDGPVRAAGIGIPAVGGSIVVGASGAVRLHDVDASGGTQASPPNGSRGNVDVQAGADVELQGTVDVSHGECSLCGIEIDAGGAVSAQKLLAQATAPSGSGGSIMLGGVSVVLDRDLVATGAGGDPDFGGTGGDVVVIADDALDVNGSILLRGTAPDGDGGTFDLAAGGTLRIGAASVLDAEGGGEGCGGLPTYLTAERDLSVGRVRVGGGSCGGGSFDAVAGRDLTVTARLTAGATIDGTGGDITLEAARTLRIDADLDAGGPVAGSGGSVTAEGCDVTLAPGVTIGAMGPDGSTTVLAHGQLTVAGRVEAGDENTLQFADAARPPIVTGVVVPFSAPVLDPALGACTAMTTCGDGTRDAAEECDDGNVDSCDGCSASCQAETCGNGRIDCAETCDPPDLLGCDAVCQVLPRASITLPGSPPRNACQAEWELTLAAPAVTARGVPEATQGCIDGDPGCDVDGGSDGRCTFRARVCLRATDPRHPHCAPAPIDHVRVKAPLPLDPDDATDAANSAALLAALGGLGVTLTQGSIVLQAGAPDPLADHCTAPIALQVPHDGRKRRRRFSLGAEDVAAKVMSNNTMRLDCFPNSAVCGDGVVEVGEHCDDANTQACDGCSPTCRTEGCGNGRIDCDEQCDAGVPTPPPASGCTAQCTEAPPALRIPGGGGSLDCLHEWGIVLPEATIQRDGRGVPRTRQECVDGDGRCDFDPAPGSCRFHLFACLGAADARLGCAAASVAGVAVLRPSPLDPGTTRERLMQALAELALPAGPGEACTRRIDVDVPAGRKTAVIKLSAQRADRKSDRDALKLRCLPAPGA